MRDFISRSGMALVAATVACVLAHSASLSAQTLPSPATRTLTPAQARAATNALDAHVADHPKSKASVVAARKSTAAATDAPGARMLRTPVPALKASGKAKKDP
jgi:uncharacterized protein YggE